jgi:hypothetical protein
MHDQFQKRIGKSGLLALILSGCAIGVWGVIQQWMPDRWQAYLQTVDSQQLFHLFLCETVGLLLCSGVVGFFAIGQPIPCVALLLHGGLFGQVLMLQMMAEKRSWSLLCWLLPYGIGSSLLLLLAARESIRFSCLFFGYAFQRQWEENMPHCRRLYLLRYLVILGLFAMLLLVCSGLQFVIQVIFS